MATSRHEIQRDPQQQRDTTAKVIQWGPEYRRLPDPILALFRNVVKTLTIRTAFDPNAGPASLIREVGNASPNADIWAAANGANDRLSANVHLINADPMSALDSDVLPPEFDLVCTVLPIKESCQRMRIRRADERTVALDDDVAALLLLKASARLSKNGIGAFVVPDRFFTKAAPNSVRWRLPEFGIYISACIAAPSRIFIPLTSDAIDVVLVTRTPQAEIFVGQLSSDERHNRVLFESLIHRKQSKDISAGTLIRDAEFRSYPHLEAQAAIKRMAQRAGLSSVLLADIAEEINVIQPGDKFKNYDSVHQVFVPRDGKGIAVTSLSGVERGYEPYRYAQVVLRPEEADADYVAEFFNRPLGRKILDAALIGNRKITKQELYRMAVYLPDVATQVEMVNLTARIRSHVVAQSERAQMLWETPQVKKKISHAISRLEAMNSESSWIETLPFPLSSVLATYLAVKEYDPKEAYECLLRFYETLAQFLATVLLSAAVSNSQFRAAVRPRVINALREEGSFDRPTFGTWASVFAVIAKAMRELLNGPPDDKELCYDLFGVRDSQLLATLVAAQLATVLQNANSERNWKAHGGMVGQIVAAQRLASLQTDLVRVRAVFQTSWDNLELLKIKNTEFSESDGTYKATAFSLRGTRLPFRRRRYQISEPPRGELYLTGLDSSRPLRLVPLLLVRNGGGGKPTATYFYMRKEGKECRFVCHSCEADDLCEPVAPLDEFLGMFRSNEKH